MILQIAFPAADVIELLPPIHLEAGPLLREDHPTESSSDTRQRMRIWGVAFGVPGVADIDERGELQPVFSGWEPEQRHSRLE